MIKYTIKPVRGKPGKQKGVARIQTRQARKFGVALSGPQAVSPRYLCIGVKRR